MSRVHGRYHAESRSTLEALVRYPAPFRFRRYPTGAAVLSLAILFFSLGGCSDDDNGPTGPGQPEFDWSGAIDPGAILFPAFISMLSLPLP